MRIRLALAGLGRSALVGAALAAALAPDALAQSWRSRLPATAPLPPERPGAALPDIRPPLPPEVPAPEVPAPQVPPAGPAPRAEAPPAPDPRQTCLADLARLGIAAEPATPPTAQNQACRIEQPVHLLSVRAAGRADAAVSFPARPILECRFVAALGQWIALAAAPLVEGHLGTELKAVQTGPGYECRNRNRAAAGKLSAHATGIALDIARLDLGDGRKLEVGAALAPKDGALMTAIRRAGCGWFTTILGPGSDAAHADHLHVDILLHGKNDLYRICE